MIILQTSGWCLHLSLDGSVSSNHVMELILELGVGSSSIRDAVPYHLVAILKCMLLSKVLLNYRWRVRLNILR